MYFEVYDPEQIVYQVECPWPQEIKSRELLVDWIASHCVSVGKIAPNIICTSYFQGPSGSSINFFLA